MLYTRNEQLYLPSEAVLNAFIKQVVECPVPLSCYLLSFSMQINYSLYSL